MGFLLTLVYIFLTYLSPEYLFPGSAAVRPMLILAIAAVVVSIPAALSDSHWRSATQTLLMLALIACIMLSYVANSWIGGMLEGLQIFLPSAIVYFLIAIHVNSMRRLKLLIASLALTAVILVGMSLSELRAKSAGGVAAANGLFPDDAAEMGVGGDEDEEGTDSDFVFQQRVWKNDMPVGVIYRIHALGFLNDPNDFSQYLVTTLPLFFVFWKRKKRLRNLVMVGLPTALLLAGIGFTRSRGAVLGLAVLLLFGFRKRLGMARSGVIAGLVLGAFLVSGASGGRDMSMKEDSAMGRLEAWSEGIAMVKGQPVLGVGFRGFTDHHKLTAHNSFVLCFAELGLVGYWVWLSLLVVTASTFGQLQVGQAPEPAPRAAATAAGLSAAGPPAEVFPPLATRPAKPAMEPGDMEAEVAKYANVGALALYSFLVTAWFLSRTYVVTLYILIALSVAIARFSTKKLAAPGGMRSWQVRAGIFLVASIITVYIFVILRF